MKKVIAILLALSIINNGWAINSLAQGNAGQANNTNSKVVVTVRNLNTGEVSVLEPSDDIDITSTVNEDGSNSIKASAEVQIPSDGEQIVPYGSATDLGMTARVTFDLDYVISGTKYKITRIWGSFENLDPSFTLSNKLVKVANYDYAQSEYIFTRSNPSNTFNYTNPFSNWADTNWPPVWVGGYARCYTSRGSTSYEVRCTITVIGQDLSGWF